MKDNYTAVVIDDERLARKELISLLSDQERINVIGEAENVPSAIELIKKKNPDVIFLDIQMPRESGFDLLDRINIKAKVIFITAFDEYAIRAFEVNALDYLLKPVSPERLGKAIEKLNDDRTQVILDKKELEYDDRLFLSLNNQLKFLKIESIVSISAAGDYTEIHVKANKNYLVNKTIKEWERRLPGKYFARIHRSIIVNLEYVDRVEKWFNYSYRIYLKGVEEPLNMSRRFAKIVKDRMG